MTILDPVALAQALIRCPSVTPKDEGALDVLEGALKLLGFSCRRLVFEEPGAEAVDNLYARIGTGAPLFCFAGHTDVVPPGGQWKSDPFGAEIREGMLYGRGAADMKSAIAAFAAAAARVLAEGAPKGSISFLITGDEEGEAINGTQKVLARLKDKGERIDHCIVGEPTSAAAVGDTIKIGRRGSMNVRVRVKGVQGHVAYPAKAQQSDSRARRAGDASVGAQARRRHRSLRTLRRFPSPASTPAMPRPMSFRPRRAPPSTSASTSCTRPRR